MIWKETKEKGRGKRDKEKSGFPPLPHWVRKLLFFRVLQKHFYIHSRAKDDSIKGNQMSFDWIIFEILKSKSVFETPWKRVALDPNGGGEETHSFSVSLFPLPFFLCLFSYQILRERGGGGRRAAKTDSVSLCASIYEINDLLHKIDLCIKLIF